MINEDLKNNFPDLWRMRLEYKIANAPNLTQKDIAASLLYLYDRGELEVSSDPWTGELKFQAAYIN